MAQKDFSGGVITKNEVEPDGGFEGSAASGMWSMGDALKYKKAGTWPTQGVTPPIDVTRLFVPYLSGAYTASFRLYNWNTDTLTTVGSQSQFYPGTNGEAGGFCILPNGDICLVGNNATVASYKNYFYLSGSSTSGSFQQTQVAYSTSYGYYFGAPTWNDQADKIQVIQGSHPNENLTPYMLQINREGTSVSSTSGNLYTSYGGSSGPRPPAITLSTIDDVGTITSSDKAILYTGTTGYNSTSGDIRKIPNPYSGISTGSSYGTPSGDARGGSMAIIDDDIVLYCTRNGNKIYRVDYDASGFTDVTSTVTTAGGLNGYVYGISKNVYATGNTSSSPSSLKLVKGDPGSSIDWVTDLDSYWNSALIWIQGYKEVLYICYRDTSDSNKIKITEVKFSDSTGAVSSSTTRDLGISGTRSIHNCQVNRYNGT